MLGGCMKDQDMTKPELLEELALLRGKIQSLEAIEKEYFALKEKIHRLEELMDDPLISGQSAASPPTTKGPKGHAATVMVVDDNEVFRELLVDALTRNGYRVLAADSVGGAMEALTESRTSVDLLLTDVVMPDGSGNELSRNIQMRFPDIKVLFMSGYSDELLVHSDVQEVMDSKDSFLQKPFLTEDLLKKVRQKLGRENR
jgi:CheY-like chemotaxis protein